MLPLTSVGSTKGKSQHIKHSWVNSESSNLKALPFCTKNINDYQKAIHLTSLNKKKTNEIIVSASYTGILSIVSFNHANWPILLNICTAMGNVYMLTGWTKYCQMVALT